MRKFFLEIVSPKARATFLLGVLACLVMAGTSSVALAKGDFLFTSQANAQVASPVASNYGLDSGFTGVGIQTDRDIKELIASIINIALGFLGILAVIIILYAGYLWMTAGGNADQIEKAKKILLGAVIGLVIILSSWAIAAFIISRLGGATLGGGSGGIGAPCSSSATSCVRVPSMCASGLTCSASCTCQYQPVGSEPFKIKAFQTTHDGPLGSYDDVYLCSSVGSIFNEMLIQPTVQTAQTAPGDDALKIVQIEENATTVFPVVDMLTKIESASNIIDITPAQFEGDKWPANSRFEVHIPKTLEGVSGRFLSKCLNSPSSICTDEGTYYSWEFNTTNKLDSDKPSFVSAYPQITPEDQNVDRKITFSLIFSEPIKTTSFLDGDTFKTGQTNIIVEEDGGSQIPINQFYVRVINNGIYFSLKDTYLAPHDQLLGHFDPYKRYKITVTGIKDLCNNDMVAQVPWYFKTNGKTAGVQGTYPPNNFANTCPTSETFIQFRTSMYNIVNDSCAVGSGLVDSGADIAERTTLQVMPNGEDGGDLPAGGWDPANPNEYCRMYEFMPDSNWLTVGDTYNPKVTYKTNPDATPITFNSAGDEWEFNVVSVDNCAYSPYITSMSPMNGAWGQCITIRGRHFSGGPSVSPYPSIYSKLTLEEHATEPLFRSNRGSDVVTSTYIDYWEIGAGKDGIRWASVPNWDDDYIVADVEDLRAIGNLEQDTDLDIDVNVFSFLDIDGDGTKETELPSNTVKFWVDSDSYIGPCLYGIRPSSGYWDDEVVLSGRNLLYGLPPDDYITFNPSFNQEPTDVSTLLSFPAADLWSDTSIRTKVPEFSIDGLVTVTINSVLSNGVALDISGEIGEPCSIDPTDILNPVAPNPIRCTSPENSVCRSSLECSPITCLCQKPDRFGIIDSTPRNQCQEACPNSVISFTTNKDILDITGGKILMIECVDENCLWAGGTVLNVESNLFFIDTNVAKIDKTLLGDKWYRVILDGGASGIMSDSNPSREIDNLNFDLNNDGINDSYSWKFHTRLTQCVPDRVVVSPNDGLLYENRDYNFKAKAYAPADNCSGTGQELITSGSFTWNDVVKTTTSAEYDCTSGSNEPLLNVVASATTEKATASVASFPENDRAERPVWICTEYSGIINGAEATLRPECRATVSSDCEVNNIDGVCTAACIGGICDPTITSISPSNGEPETWATINGCYFGNDWGKVEFNSVKASKPDEVMCGNTWSNTQVIAEVDSATPLAVNPVELVRTTESPHATSTGPQFTVDTDIYPGICKLAPVRGKNNSVVGIKGQNFGSFTDFNPDHPTKYNITLTDFDANIIVMDGVVGPEILSTCPSGGWSTDSICIRVVNNPAIGIGQIKVVSNTVDSNSIIFTVTDPARLPGARDMFIKTYTPGQTALACPNMLVEVNLEGELNLASIGVNLTEELDAAEILLSNFFVEDSGGNRLKGIIGAESSASASKLQFLPKEPFAFGETYTIVLDTNLKTTSEGDMGSHTGDVCEEINITNQLVNGDMEIEYGGALIDWSATNMTTAKDIVAFKSGIASMKVEKNADDAYVQPSTAFTGDGSTYKITGYSYIPTIDGVLYTYIAIYDLKNREVILKTDRAAVDTWQEHSFYLDTIDGDEYKVKLGIEGDNTKIAYFDDITLKKVEDITSCEIDFKVVDVVDASQCYVDHLSISPSSPVFSCAGRNNCETDDDSVAAGNQEVFSVELISKNNQPIISPRGLVGYWSFNDKYVSGDDIFDQSGNDYDAQINPTGTATAGQVGKSGEAILFGGATDRVRGEMEYDFKDEVTLSAWFKSPGGGINYPRIIEFSDSSGDLDHGAGLVYNGSNGALSAWVTCEDGGNRDGVVISSTVYNDDEWHHAVYTYNSQGAKLYVDSKKITESASSCNDIYGAETFAIGNYYPSANRGFIGLIDEVRIYDRALSAYEVMNLYLVPGPSYTWETSDITVMSLATPSTQDFHYYNVGPITGSVANGSAIITSTVDGSSITGSTEARVFMCENPWPASMSTDGIAFNDKSGDPRFTSQTPKTNFSTFYCRDRGDKNSTDDDLPMLPIGDTTVSKIGHCAGGTNNEALCNIDSDCEDTSGDKHGRCIGLKEFGATTAGADRVVPGLIKETFFIQPWSKVCKEGIDEKKGHICASNYDCDPAGKGICVSPIDGGGIDVMSVRVLGVKWCAGGMTPQEIALGNIDACVDDADCGSYSCVVNPEYFSIRNWYNNQSDLEGSPASIFVDRFDALQDGRSIYVNAPNHASSVIYNNIYLISINDKAHEDSINIYNQLVGNWRFLVNVDIGEKEKLRRDLVRVNDAYYVADLIGNKQFPVELESGTLQKGMSLSTWDSWSQTLGPRLGGTMPLDPKSNNIVCASRFELDQTTCWDPLVTLPSPQYKCDTSPDSQFYLYKANSTTSTFGFNLEYGSVADWDNVFIGTNWGDGSGFSCINKTYQKVYP